jgi:SAM-dependent methyltransferase
MSQDLHEANRLSWNAATAAHNSHKGDQAAWLRAGGDTLFPEELELLGPLDGVSLVHLQCNAGQDSLCLARRGARVTGVDISDEAVGFATKLSEESGIAASFEREDVFTWLERAGLEGRRWDVAFSSYGALPWLSDVRAWARGIAGVLRPGGRFVLVEFHPVAQMFDDQMRLNWSYSGGGRPWIWEQGVSDYVARSGAGLLHGAEYQEGVVDFQNPHACHEFFWGIGEVVQALLDAGLMLETLREYPYTNGCVFYEGQHSDDGRRYRLPEGVPELPLMYGLSARKPA